MTHFLAKNEKCSEKGFTICPKLPQVRAFFHQILPIHNISIRLLNLVKKRSVKSVNDNNVKMFQVSRNWSSKMFAGLNKVFSMSKCTLLFPRKLIYSFHRSNPTLNSDLNKHSNKSGGEVDRN